MSSLKVIHFSSSFGINSIPSLYRLEQRKLRRKRINLARECISSRVFLPGLSDDGGAGYAYREALKIGEEKKFIRKQLKYIEYLRSGGKPVQPSILTTGQPKRWWQFCK
jgi:hypothetical protein